MDDYPCSVTTNTLRLAIKRLQPDLPINDPKKWYKTQKQHWLGWLHFYKGPGAYGRKTDVKHDARYAYNHIVEYKMLLYLAEAVGIEASLILKVRIELADKKTLMEKSGTVRKHISWDMIAFKLWPSPEVHSQSYLKRLMSSFN